ncbi:MAG TPA: hypothetical protein VGL59_16875 [Polyangia bacterium]|jgi:hypothetical protein
MSTTGRRSVVSSIFSAAAAFIVAFLVGCGGQPPRAIPVDATAAHPTPIDARAADAAPDGDRPSAFLVEKTVTVGLALLTAVDGGVASVVIPGAANAADAGPPDGPPAAVILQITARDGLDPVRTDLWLYALVDGALQPFTDFSAVTNRKAGRLLLPATIAGQRSGLVPADDGRLNGLMTDVARGSLVQGAFVSAVDGTVTVNLAAAPTTPLVVLAGVEDQRYAGAAAIFPDGSPGAVPASVGLPETHARRSFSKDVAPILKLQCIAACHNPGGPLTAALYPMNTRDQLVNNNYAFSEQAVACRAKYPADSPLFNGCLQAITKAQYLVEPGAPALSDLLLRARPDEEAGSSALGLAWFGGGSPRSRYNATYGDRRMPSTTVSPDQAQWLNAPTAFDMNPQDFQVLFDWVAQGAPED